MYQLTLDRRFKIFLEKLGFNKTIGITISNRVIQAGVNFFIIILISLFLTKAQQGYYYTFNSMLAMQVFFELGLGAVLTQVIAHEFAFLSFSPDRTSAIGDVAHKSRIASILKLSFKWYAVSALLLLLIIGPLGYYFFQQKEAESGHISWFIPWVLVVLATCLNLLSAPYVSIIEGVGKIFEVTKFRFYQMLICYPVLIISLTLHWGLYSLGLFLLSNAICTVSWLVLNKKNRLLFIDFIKSSHPQFQVDWKKEVFPFQWKIAASWLSGYFIFQTLNPLLFAYKGPVVAGQMGITMAVFNGLSSISMAWIYTKVPTFSMLIARQEFEELDNIFFKSLKQALSLAVISAFGAWIALLLINKFLPQYSNRFLFPAAALFIAINSLGSQLVYALGIYLRCHKKEPYLIPSIAGAVVTASIAFICAKWLSVFYLTLSLLLVSMLIFLPWSIKIFMSSRLKWHSK
ncbi:MAG TPA: hypothetical protein VKA92_14010 [Segetibacter sp.]|nr:hypothetical protein [Segetibacter sp.]